MNVRRFVSVEFQNREREPPLRGQRAGMIGGKGFFSLHFSQPLFSRRLAKNLQKKIAGTGKRDLILLMEALNWASEGKKVMIQACWKWKPDKPSPHFISVPKSISWWQHKTASIWKKSWVKLELLPNTQKNAVYVVSTGLSQNSSHTWSNQSDCNLNWNSECDNKIIRPQWLVSMKLNGIWLIIHMTEYWTKAEHFQLLFINI